MPWGFLTTKEPRNEAGRAKWFARKHAEYAEKGEVLTTN
jgi:hypothetical protein